jgi:hypothetical protein
MPCVKMIDIDICNKLLFAKFDRIISSVQYYGILDQLRVSYLKTLEDDIPEDYHQAGKLFDLLLEVYSIELHMLWTRHVILVFSFL